MNRVLRAAEKAARDGSWVAGFVTYEAAPGFDASLPALGWRPDHPLHTLPLAWFGTFGRRDAVATIEPPASVGPGRAGWRLDQDHAWHRRAIAAIKDGIAAGDYYQVNLTTRLTGQLEDPLDLYRRLAISQAGQFHSLIVTHDHTVISASPELFFARDGDLIVTRPMKGTARRGRWPEEDLAQARNLRGSEKERAENIMIVDLIRNDLGRIATPGSVRVPTLLHLERYPTVWQLTSTITARVPPEVDLARVFGALFPSGSITGAPKMSSMRAIAALERRPRGVYCGAVGYLRPNGETPAARFAVAIRTIARVNASGYAEYGAGGAITWSSVPDAEWAELRAKTAVLQSAPYPDRLLETLRFEPPDAFVNLPQHLARLADSANYFAIPSELPDIAAPLSTAVAGRDRTARVRIVLHRSGQVQVQVEDFAPTPVPVRLQLAGGPVDSQDIMLFHKHGDRHRYDRMRRLAPDVDDVILWNERGHVTETTTANLAVHLDGRWWTPTLACGLLPGVERARLLDEGRLAEREITTAELEHADIAVLNSLRGWRPALLDPPAAR